MIDKLIRTLLRGYGRLLPGGTRNSRPVEGNASTMRIGEKLWWAHKFFVRPVEQAQRGTDIERRFARMRLGFEPPTDFTPELTGVLASGGDLLSAEQVRPDNTTHLFDDVADFAFEADLTIANLETPVAPSRSLGAPPRSILSAPPLNSSVGMLRVFTGIGSRYGFFSTANNHCLDQGIEGLRETLDVLDAEGIGHVGTARTPSEQDDIPVVDMNGIRVAVLSYTFSVNGRPFPPEQAYSANYVRLNLENPDLGLIEKHVTIARSRGADAIVACAHWSLEFESFPIQHVIDNGHRIADLGVDVILGNHPHVVQPMERYRFTDPATDLEKDALIVYAQGDTVSYLPAVPNSMLGMLVRVQLTRGVQNGIRTTRVTGVEHRFITTAAVFDGDTCTDFRVLDLDAELDRPTATPGTPTRAELQRLRALADRLAPRE
ncbi:CapA family protein [Microbacterium sp. NPDC057650]|uniref:CapA family protein n=1 Tax=unclassified Microbacterium TaxID=2609290 RepID=UPI00367289A8